MKEQNFRRRQIEKDKLQNTAVRATQIATFTRHLWEEIDAAIEVDRAQLLRVVRDFSVPQLELERILVAIWEDVHQ